MTSRFERVLGRFLAALSDRVRGSALAVVLACLALSSLSLAYAAGHLGINADITSLIDEDLPYLQVRRDFERAFPLLQHVLLVVVDAEHAEAAADAADLLGNRLGAEKDVFQDVFVPGGGSFFARNALLYVELDRLEDLADHLAEAQPYLAALARDPTLGGFFGLLEQALEAMASEAAEHGHALDATELLDAVSEALVADLEGRPRSELGGPLGLGEASFEDATRRVVLLSPVLDFEDLQPAKRAVERVRRVVEETGLARQPGVTVRITGEFALSYDEMAILKQQAGAAGLASFVLVALLLALALRSLWLIAAVLTTLLAGLACSLGFAAAGVGHLNPISVAFAALFIGLSVDFGIHLCLRYREARSAGQPHAEALNGAARGTGASLVLCAFTTAIGFYAFVPTEFLGVAELGLIAGTGMGISLFFSLTLLPALIELAPARTRIGWGAARRGDVRPTLPGLDLGARHPYVVRRGALAAFLVALVLIPQAHFDYNPLRVRDPNAESVRALEDLLSQPDGSPWAISVVAENAEAAAPLARRLEALDVVASAITPEDFVPSDQSEKLELIEEISFFMGPPPGAARTVPDQASESGARKALASLRAELARFLSSDGPVDPTLRESARRLEAALTRLGARVQSDSDSETALAALDGSLVAPIRRGLRALHLALEAEPVELDDLPAGLRRHTLGHDGRVRVQVLPRADLNDRIALAHFVDGVRSVTPRATGLPVHYLESGRAIVRSFQQALISAALAIALLLLALWRRIGDTLLVLTTLGLAGVLTTAIAVAAGIPFNFADVIVLPLLLGIGVDSSIHLVHRFRSEAQGADELVRSSTARGVFFSALTTIAGFGSLGFTPHRGLATLGQLLTIGVVVTLFCNLVVLPAFLERRKAR